jgi:hypothetical protein
MATLDELIPSHRRGVIGSQFNSWIKYYDMLQFWT